MARRKFTLNRSLSSAVGFVLLAVSLVAVNWLAGLLPWRLDITEEGLYTLSQGSRNILTKLEEPVTIKYYRSESAEETPVTIKGYFRKVRELLAEYVNRAGGRIVLEMFDPKPDSEEEEWAERYGLAGAQMPQGSRLYHGMVVLSGGREAAIPFFDPRRERFLEFDISEAITRVGRDSQPTLGIISSLPVVGRSFNPGGQPSPDWAFIAELRKNFNIVNFFPAEVVEIPETIDMVLLVHPKAVSADMAYALDQFLMRGGRLMAFTDPHSRFDVGGPQALGGKFNSNLEKLFKAWRVKFDPTQVVADEQLATKVNAPGAGIVDFPVWLTVRADNMNKDSIITNQLEEIMLVDAGAFEPDEGFKYQFTPLLTTSKDSGLVNSITVRMTGPLDIIKGVKKDGKARVLAALISGTFETAFPEGPPKPDPNESRSSRGKKTERKFPHRNKAEKETTVLLVGDADFLSDRYSVRQINFFGQPLRSPINDNLTFVLNAAEFMAGSQELIHIRSRGRFSRPFTRVDSLQKAAQVQFREQEQALTEKLQSSRKRLEQLEGEKGPTQSRLPSEAQLEEIKRIRMDLLDTRRKLRGVRKVLRQDIETLGNRLLVINLLALPLLVAIFGFITIYIRSKRSGGGP